VLPEEEAADSVQVIFSKAYQVALEVAALKIMLAVKLVTTVAPE